MTTTTDHPTLEPFMDIDLPLPDRRDGKVRVSYEYGPQQRLFVTTDRLSAFDRVIAGVPCKGQVLNQLAAWWFATTSDIVANHVVAVPDPNVLIARTARLLPVEVVVRGYITGVTTTSLWHLYSQGAREIYGHTFPNGLLKNTELPDAIVTPTTKAEAGHHDEPIGVDDVVRAGLVGSALWAQVQQVALTMFRRGQEVAANAGLILADTKYEFGLGPDGELMVVDEIHTPDSSRYWVADSYAELLDAAQEPESLDKEVVRRALRDAGYQGDGPPPELPAEVWQATSQRYIDTFERLTATPFQPGRTPVAERIQEWHRHAS